MAAIFAQIALIALVMRKADIETLGFHRIVYIAVLGFIPNHLLPRRLRLGFFLGLSLFSMLVALGGSAASTRPNLELGVARGSLIFCMGVVLIAICRLPIRFWKRAILLGCAGAFAALFRSGRWWDSKELAVVWPVLAALFMFRIIVYLYDVSTAARRPTNTQSLAYFFLTPNFCALLFPVIDFRTFCQTYYNEEDLVIYQRGVKWMTRGIIQLLIYRMVEQLFAIAATSVHSGTDLIQFVVANIFLYLKVSGSFHLFVGILLLFGFNLPETNHRYFLAASFTDYWRRVNIYWRAFIMKVFYYPTFFRLKGLGQVTALVVATIGCFVITWALHVYQTWWLVGSVSWTWTDALFWSALALLVLGNSLWELKQNRKRRLTKGSYTWREAASVTVRTALTFSVITVLWSLWSTPTLELWVHIWTLADIHTVAWGGAAVGCVMVATVLFEILPAVKPESRVRPRAAGYARSAAFCWDSFSCVLPLLALLAAVHFSLRFQRRPAEVRNSPVAAVLAHTLTDGETGGEGRGYYENLTSPDNGSSQFAEAMTAKFKTKFALMSFVFDNDANAYELKPNVHLVVDGMPVDTNQWGMRDRERSLIKPPDGLRMAVLGSSHAMGYGLPAKDMFETVLEDRLNAEHRLKGGFEMLNFSVSGQSPLGQIWMLQHRAVDFRPDVVLFVAHINDFEWAAHDAEWDLRRNVPLPPGFPTELFAEANVSSRTIEAFAVQRLKPQQPGILSFCYRQLVQGCQSINALPVCILLPVPTDLPFDKKKAAALLQIATDAGFVTIDLTKIYDGLKPDELMLRDIGRHSNAKANILIANALYDRLTADPRIDLQGLAKRINAGAPADSLANKSSDPTHPL